MSITLKVNIYFMKKIILSLLFFLSIAPLKMLAQKNIIDEVIWVVGDESILKSQVEEQKLRAQYENTPIQGDPYCVIPEQIAIQKQKYAIDLFVTNNSTMLSAVPLGIQQAQRLFVQVLGRKAHQPNHPQNTIFYCQE